MYEDLLTFELLPNELLIEIFSYLNTPDLFQSFYNLNIHLNKLIQSINNLHLIISKDNNNILNINLISPFIHSLIIIGDVNINFNNFQNLHYLILHHPTNKLLKQFENNNILPNLEYLSIPDILFGMSFIFEKIFSNKFSYLKSCNLFGFETIETIKNYTQITSLYKLKIGLIDFYVYKKILFSCPNLNYFKFKIFQSYLKLSDIYIHKNLKKLEISSEIDDYQYNDQLIDSFLKCVSNLEQLIINRTISISKLSNFIPDYDWFASIISLHLPFLKYLIVCINFEYHSEFIQFISAETRRELRKFFLNAHQKSYQSRLIIK